jgi:hypothetical protein
LTPQRKTISRDAEAAGGCHLRANHHLNAPTYTGEKMKKSIIVLLVMGLVASMALAVPAQAKKKKVKKVVRTATGTYQAPSLIAVGTCTSTDAVGCVVLPTASNESYITSAKVTDQTGQPVYVSVQADTNGDAQDDAIYGSFCGELTEPLQIDPGTQLHFWVGVTPDPGIVGCVPGAATSGTVDATFSNMPK